MTAWLMLLDSYDNIFKPTIHPSQTCQNNGSTKCIACCSSLVAAMCTSNDCNKLRADHDSNYKSLRGHSLCTNIVALMLTEHLVSHQKQKLLAAFSQNWVQMAMIDVDE